MVFDRPYVRGSCNGKGCAGQSGEVVWKDEPTESGLPFAKRGVGPDPARSSSWKHGDFARKQMEIVQAENLRERRCIV